MWAKMFTSVLMTVAGKLIAALGLSFVSYVGLNELQSYLISAVQHQIGSLPADGLQLAYMAGLGVCLNWIFGTFAFVISLKSLNKLSAGIAKK